MGTVAIKEILHSYIDTGDDKLLQMIYAMVREYNNPVLNKTDIAELEKRTESRRSGQSKVHGWATAKSRMQRC
jgi:predicted HAD superfamily phosphohydrolase